MNQLECPKCGKTDYHLSHSRNVWEDLRKSLLNQRTYRCHSCNYRGWEKIKYSFHISFKKIALYFFVFIIALIIGYLTSNYMN
jgi:hypothetical protein